jgi:hypothetical protein
VAHENYVSCPKATQQHTLDRGITSWSLLLLLLFNSLHTSQRTVHYGRKDKPLQGVDERPSTQRTGLLAVERTTSLLLSDR